MKNINFKSIILTLTLLLSLGVGQMWAWFTISSTEDIYFDAVDQYTRWSLSTNNLYVKVYYGDGQGSNNVYQMTKISGTKLYYCGSAKGHSNVSGIEFFAGANSSTYSYGTGKIKFDGWSNALDRLDRMCYTNSTSTNWNWDGNIDNPPLSTISLAKYSTTTYGGDGTEGDPYLVASGSKVQVQVSSTKRSSNLTAKYKFTVNSSTDASHTTTTTKTVTNSAANGTTYEAYVQGWGYSNSSYSRHSITSGTVYFQGVDVYSVTYNDNGSTDGSVPSESGTKYVSGTNVTLATNSGSLAKTNYSFNGWNTAADGSGTHYDAGGTLGGISADQTLYAEWVQTITVDKNTGTTAGSMSICFNAGSLKTFTAATKTDWVLDSYWTSSDESGVKVINYDGTNATLISNVTGYTSAAGKWTRTAATTLYAHWKQTYRVYYYTNFPEGETTSGSAPSDATEYSSGTTVTVLGQNTMSVTGYSFNGWNTNPDGSGTARAASSTFSISGNTTLFAQWSENMTTVNFVASPSGSGTFTVGSTPSQTSTTAGVTTTRSVTAVPYPGYRITGSNYWTAQNENISLSSRSTNPTTVTGCGTASTSSNLTATFTQTYAFVEGRLTIYNSTRSSETNVASSNGGWDKSSTRMPMTYDGTNHRFYLHTYKTPSQLSAQQSSQYQWFSFMTSTASGSLTSEQAFEPASNQEMTTTGSENKKTVSAASTDKHIRFNSDVTNGYAILYFDESGVWYTLEHTLNYNGNDAASGSAPASEAYYNNGTNATAASNTYTGKTNYSFAGWNTDQYITGTTYAAGASVPMTANTTLYAKWNRTVTLEQEDATTEGSTSVVATWNCATLPEIDNPKKTGYEFGGWYTEIGGGGNIIINTSGQLQASKTNWTDGSGRFQRTPSSEGSESKPLYAKWTQTVTLNANTSYHGSGDNTSATIVYKATAKSSITHCTPATGYHLAGYYTAATGGTKILNADGSFAGSNITVSTTPYISSGKWVKAGATTLYAQYAANTYTINFDANDSKYPGTATGSTASVGATYDADVTLTSNGFSRAGYTFAGWATSTTGAVEYSDGETLTTPNFTSTNGGSYTLYAKWTENMTTVTLSASPTGKGTFTVGGAPASSTTAGVTTKRTVAAVAGTGYHVNTSATVWATNNSNITLSSTTTNPTTVTGCGTVETSSTLTATFTPNTYTVCFNKNKGSGTMSNQAFTYDVAQALTSNSFTRTGYNFSGWATTSGGSVAYTNGQSVSNLSSVDGGTVTLFAVWTAKTYTITLDKQTGATGYGSAGSASNPTATYNAVLPTISGTMPTATTGYKFMGFYTEENGEGLQLTDGSGTWIASVEGYTDGSKKWIHDGAVTLYAYYKKAEITNLAFDYAVVESNATVGITPTISPTPEGSTTLCWYVYYSNDNKLDPQPEMSFSAGKLTFQAPEASGTYKVAAVLRTGSGSCPYVGGTLLDSAVTSFQVAGLHTVTIRYKCGDEVIKEATSIGARPLDWSDEIAAPEIFGYTFKRWSAGDGVTLTADNGVSTNTDTTATPIKIKAVYDGYLTATYTKKDYIYFKNTMGWGHVDVYFYTSDKYWDDTEYGSGSKKDKEFKNGDDDHHKPHYDEKHGRMTHLEGTDIWYLDAGAIGCRDWTNIVFNANTQNNYEWFSATELVRRGDFKRKTPMFVPADKTKYTPTTKNKSANYYNKGYWVNYLGENTGYTLEVYQSDGSTLVKSLKFTSEDKLMPMSATLNLEAGTTYKFRLKRDGNSSGDVYYGNTGRMQYDSRYGGNATPWSFESGVGKCELVTTAAGDYTFHMTYSQNTEGVYALRIAVEYPIADGDYRVLYKDDVHTAFKPSAIVPKVNNGKDTVSYFIRPGQNPTLKIQQASVNNEGATSWSVGTDVSSSLSALSKDSVYNICLTMNESGAISVEKVEAYTGNYYIRTDAANSKWDNWKSDPDHLMTYSEYSINHGGYSHYYCHWVRSSDTGRKNVKFCIANDYSPCISDTLIRESNAVSGWENIDNYITSGGDLQRNANVRFMWNRHDNTISRAYVDGAQGDHSANFLYMLNTDNPNMIRWSEESALTSNKVTFSDNGNWIYEANIQAQPNAQIRVLSNWGTENTITQYFKGSSSTSEPLIGGSGTDWYPIRVIYDFKTNRLVASWLPNGEISGNVQINADVMFIREHQGDIAQLTFTTGSKISKIETAYGVLRLNKWTLNNKDKSTHSPLGTLKSRYERDLFYISFPFRVSMEEVFGFGTYGTHWIIEEYDGASRAANGYWLESAPNWKFVTNRKNKFFEPGQGYIIALDLDELGESSDVWDHTDQVELYFPSYGTMPDITSSSATYNIPSHLCTINRSGESNGNGGTLGSAYDRRVKDSHWNVLGVPTYVNPDAPTFANTSWITAGDGHVGPNFLYAWNPDDNTVTAVSGTGYDYHAMHAYLVQYCGNVTWTSSVSPTTAPRRNPDYRGEYEFRLEMLQNDEAVDQTYIKLSDNEAVTTGFEFNYDLSKEYNKNKANIYTLIGEEPVAGNVLPLTDQTTVIPVGIKIVVDGNYTFTMPEGSEGIGVTLIDNETGIRTPLSALDYTVNLTAGTIDGRFVLEISPISQNPTDIEAVSDQNSAVRKVMIDGLLYIVKGDRIYDATGALVK